MNKPLRRLSMAEIIKETGKAFNIHKRADLDQGNCFYHNDHPHFINKTCGLGRCLIRESRKIAQIQHWGSISINPDITETVLDKHLMPQYRGYSKTFWIDIQTLHDTFTYWEDHGLSALGQSVEKSLLEKWSKQDSFAQLEDFS